MTQLDQDFAEREPVKQVPTNVVLPVIYRTKLRHLAKVTRVSQAAYIREALADLLLKYRDIVDENTSETSRSPQFD